MKQEHVEITVKVSDDEQKLTRKFSVHHEGIRLSHDDPTLAELVADVEKEFKPKSGEAETLLSFKMVWLKHA